MILVHWPLMGRLLHLVQRGGDWAESQPAQAPPLCTKCNSPPISGQCTSTVLLYRSNGPLLCGFNAHYRVNQKSVKSACLFSVPNIMQISRDFVKMWATKQSVLTFCEPPFTTAKSSERLITLAAPYHCATVLKMSWLENSFLVRFLIT